MLRRRDCEGYGAHPAGIMKSNSSGLLVAWRIPILRVATVRATFLLIEDVKVLLVEEAQDGELLHNTWCSGSSCGGINPYTLTARLGPGGLAHYETSLKLDPTAWSFTQGRKMWRSSRILVG